TRIRAAMSYLVFISGPTGYELREHDGDPPSVGAEVEHEGHMLRVSKLAPAVAAAALRHMSGEGMSWCLAPDVSGEGMSGAWHRPCPTRRCPRRLRGRGRALARGRSRSRRGQRRRR